MGEFIVCIPARFLALLRDPFVERTCALCGEPVLLAMVNQKIAAHMDALCILCAFRQDPELLKRAGAIANGQKFDDLITGLRAAEAAERRN